LRETIKIKN